MTAFKNSAVIVCVCCIVCSIISLVAPLGKMKKIMNLILGMFLLCSMVIPVVGLFDSLPSGFEFDGTITEYDGENTPDYDKMVLNQTADNLVLAADNLLKNEGIEASNIELALKKTDNNSIYISSVVIYITKQYENRAQDISKIIGSNMSKEPVIIVNE